MRGLQAAVILMGVLIVLGVAVVGVTIVQRLHGGTPGAVALVLDEPAGTRMVSAAAGGGPGCRGPARRRTGPA